MMKLNIWVRAGLLASLVWAVAAAAYSYSADEKKARDFAELFFHICADGQSANRGVPTTDCDAERVRSYQLMKAGNEKNAAFLAIAPLPLLWLGSLSLLYLCRALAVGFPTVLPWRRLNVSKRGLVVICVLFSSAICVNSLLLVLNLYVDSKVPVGMSSFADVSSFGDFATVSGTWTRTDLTDDTIAAPLQTSKIECNRVQNRCTEARASVAETTFVAELIDYDIQSWTPDSIHMRRDDDCLTEVFTIDLNTKAVTGAGYRTNQQKPGCSYNSGIKASWSYHLVPGFNVYWALRLKARPWPLRVLQSFAGN